MSLKRIIPELHKEDYIKVSLYAWVNAQMSLLPSLTKKKAIQNFLDKNKISEDEYSLKAAIQDYDRTREKEIKSLKSK